MRIKQPAGSQSGYTSICSMENDPLGMLMDIGTLRLAGGEQFEIFESGKETAILLVRGTAVLSWGGQSTEIARGSFIGDDPWCLHVPPGTAVRIESRGDSEWIIQKTTQENAFDARLYTPAECRSEQFGAGTLDETSTRTVRTIFDFHNAPWSNLVIGEVINHPGRWSSYPPHDHPQPEVYHYRFEKKQGFGISVIEEEAFVVRDTDTVCIPPGTVHPQVTAPGYPMWYCWMIRHLPGNPFDERCFREEHKWLLGD